MQIIRHASECRWVTTCSKCGCVFVYKGEDIRKQPAEEFYGGSKARMGALKELEVPDIASVECPECAYAVRIPNMAMYRRIIPFTDEMGDEWEE